ncbi:MAG: response regulator [Alphaproteobacteria bacterium]|nr:response regulator [Alphaproteobacteria bacterium]MCW5743963.1 response regulator [Alphaproteobacteria bacterium]
MPVDRASVLVVEDEAALRRTIAAFLGRRGFRVRDSADGETAAAILGEDRHIDILFCDFNLAGTMSGLDLAAWTRAHHPEVRILLTTGAKLPAGCEQGVLDAPPLRKPYSADDVLGRINALIGGGA